MEKDRLTAFTDGVIAVIITIMVLDLKPPHGTTLEALAEVCPVFVIYVLSFVYVAIYWNNHHHFYQIVPEVNGAVLWSNMHLLFWLSLIPFATSWAGEHGFAPWPTAVYGLSLLMPAIAWYIEQLAIMRLQGADSALKRALGRDLKGKLSPFVYLTGIGLAFVMPALSYALYAGVALMWLVPDRRVENAVAGKS